MSIQNNNANVTGPQHYLPDASDPNSFAHSHQHPASDEEDDRSAAAENAALTANLKTGNHDVMKEGLRKVDLFKERLKSKAGLDDAEFKEKAATIKEAELEIYSLRKSIHAEQVEKEEMVKFWTAEYERIFACWDMERQNLTAALERRVNAFKAEWNRQLTSERQQVSWKLNKAEQMSQEFRNIIKFTTDKVSAQVKQHFEAMRRLRDKQIETDQREKEWQSKFNALGERFKRELVEREEKWKRREREIEERWKEVENLWQQRNKVMKD